MKHLLFITFACAFMTIYYELWVEIPEPYIYGTWPWSSLCLLMQQGLLMLSHKKHGDVWNFNSFLHSVFRWLVRSSHDISQHFECCTQWHNTHLAEIAWFWKLMKDDDVDNDDGWLYLTRYVRLCVAHAPGMPGTFPPTADFKGNR